MTYYIHYKWDNQINIWSQSLLEDISAYHNTNLFIYLFILLKQKQSEQVNKQWMNLMLSSNDRYEGDEEIEFSAHKLVWSILFLFNSFDVNFG